MQITPELAETLNRMNEVMRRECVPADLKAKGWEYRDMPGRVTPEAWDILFGIIGEGEYELIAMSEGSNSQGPWRRGQFCISPKGLQNLRDHQAACAQS